MIELTDAEREAFRPPEGLTLSQWAAKYRILDGENSAAPGPWDNLRTPYLVGPMDALSDRRIKEVTVMKGVQMGFTEAALNWLAYIIDQEPGPTMYVLPREKDCLYMSDRRLKTMLRHNPQVARHQTGRKTDNKQLEMGFDRMPLYFAFSTKPADLASKPIRYLLLDELDKFETWTQGEGSPITLAKDRLRTFWNSKLYKLSTPTTKAGHIHSEFLKSDQRRFWVQCPKCYEHQVLVWSQVKFPGDIREPDRIKAGLLASYECEHCGHRIKDGSFERELFLRSGVWAPKGAKVDQGGNVVGGSWSSHAGFHISSLYSLWVPWSDLVADFLEAKKDPAKLMTFVNQHLAEVWEEKAVETTEVKLREKCCLPYVSGEVPEGAEHLTAGVDVQEGYFKFVVRAWSQAMESWLVEAGRLETWRDVVARVLNASWEGHKVRLACIDSGFDAWTVYEFCQRFPDVCRPTKGASRPMPVPYQVTVIEKNKRTGKVIKGGLALWVLNTDLFKDKILRFRQVGDDEEGGWHLPQDIGEDYLAEIAAERKVFERDKTGRKQGKWKWVLKYHGASNHFLDCEVYATAAAEMLIDPMGRPGGKARRPRQAPQRQVRRGGSGSGGLRWEKGSVGHWG